MKLSISIQTDDFSQSEEYQILCNDAPSIGAIVTFCGLVREFDDGRGEALFLEHFAGMTETALTRICEQAAQRWPIINARIIHRIGPMHLLPLIHISEPTRQAEISYAVLCLKKKTYTPFTPRISRALTTPC